MANCSVVAWASYDWFKTPKILDWSSKPVDCIALTTMPLLTAIEIRPIVFHVTHTYNWDLALNIFLRNV